MNAKTKHIIYWIATVWLALGMVSSGIMQLLQNSQEIALFTKLGYPIYFMVFLGIAKLLAVVAILLPKYPLLKERAYAGLGFTMVGAIVSHLAVGESLTSMLPALLLLLLTIVSWYFRPGSKKLI